MTARRVSSAQWRDSVLFLTGLGLAIYEVVIRTGSERPSVLLLIAGMMGLPAFLKADDRADGQAKERAGEEQKQ